MKIYYPAGDRTSVPLKQRHAGYHLSQRGELTKCNIKQLKSFYDNYKRGGTFGRMLDDIIVKLLALIKDQTEPFANTMDCDASFHENHSTMSMLVLRPNFKVGNHFFHIQYY